MVSAQYRYNAFVELGDFLRSEAGGELLESWAAQAHLRNNWFVPENVLISLKAIAERLLDPVSLKDWAEQYQPVQAPSRIGVVMAGNIPAVGFHDALCVLISGHHLLAKLSADDTVLMKLLLDKLCGLAPAMAPAVTYVERLNEADAYIATGSDNTARYFEYYFSRKPHIIRRNRTSVAVLSGHETPEELEGLAEDVLRYYGLGCRNVSKVWVPAGYDFAPFYRATEKYHTYAVHHHKYFNNYEYNKSVLLINGTAHLDNGFLLLSKNEALVSPLSVLYFEEYTDPAAVRSVLEERRDKIQCIVAAPEFDAQAVPFGKSQSPGLTDYADGVDVMAFLEK